MDRKDVNDDPNQTCSAGLHVCSQAYGMYGSRLLLVSVNPADVVSVPIEYKNAKMRVCKYYVKEDVDGFRDFKDEPVYYDHEDFISSDWNL